MCLQCHLSIKLHVDNPTPLWWYLRPATLDRYCALHGHIILAAFEIRLVCCVDHLLIVTGVHVILHVGHELLLYYLRIS